MVFYKLLMTHKPFTAFGVTSVGFKQKMVGFGSDSASTMIGERRGVIQLVYGVLHTGLNLPLKTFLKEHSWMM